MRREKIIGSAAPRVGSREKVTGRALYAVDLTLPNMLWGKVLRSPIAYGRIKRIDVCDFFSRWIIAWEVVPTVNGGNMKAIYQAGLKAQGISIHSKTKPELRVDRGSPNTSGVTQEFFEALGAELSFARVRHPTDNALTERFYATVKQEEIYLMGNYLDELSAREELGRYIESYNHSRPHQALFNFTPAHVLRSITKAC